MNAIRKRYRDLAAHGLAAAGPPFYADAIVAEISGFARRETDDAAELVAAAARRRPDLLDPIEQHLERQRVHHRTLHRLVAEVANRDTGPTAQTPLFADRVRQWVDSDEALAVCATNLLFRLYWDDVGGEA